MNPFADIHYKAGIAAKERGEWAVARTHLETAVTDGNVVALLELCEACGALGDRDALIKHSAQLEALVIESPEHAYVASKAFEYGACRELVGSDRADEKRRRYLMLAAEGGNPVAQLEVAENYAGGLNNFECDPIQSEEWLRRAKQSGGYKGQA